MPGTTKDMGLCSNCVHAATCMYLKDKVQPICHCEEYCSDEGPCEKSSPKTTASSTAQFMTAAAHHNDTASHYKGLCTDCVHRENCSLSNTPGGVWHCEEYE